MPLHNTPISSLPIVVFDTETTGLYTMSAWMVEIAGVRMSGSMVTTGVFQTLVRPDAIIPPDATAVHGITDDEVRDSPPTDEVLRAFLDWATTGKPLKDNGEPFRSMDDIISDLGFVPEEEDDRRIIRIEGIILGDKQGRDIVIDEPERETEEEDADSDADQGNEKPKRIIRLDVPPIPPMERPSPERLKKIYEAIERKNNPFFENETEEEPHWNKAAPPGVPIDIPWMMAGSEWDIIEGEYKSVDGIKHYIKGVRDFPELRGEKPPVKPPKPKPVIFAAHNAQYDLGILSTAFRRTGLKPPAEFICIDTCALARRVLHLNGYSLEKIVEYIASRDDIEIPFIDVESDDCLGIDAAMFAMQGFHRALCDSFHAAVVLSHLLQVTGMDRDGTTTEDLNRRYPGVVSFGIADQRTTVELPLHLAALNVAIEAQTDVQIFYSSQGLNGELLSPKALPRRIKPLGVYGSKDKAYLEAFCYIDGIVKTFRVDRIREVTQ